MLLVLLRYYTRPLLRSLVTGILNKSRLSDVSLLRRNKIYCKVISRALLCFRNVDRALLSLLKRSGGSVKQVKIGTCALIVEADLKALAKSVRPETVSSYSKQLFKDHKVQTPFRVVVYERRPWRMLCSSFL